MNKFENFFFNHDKQLSVHKWHHYFEIYDRHFKKFIGRNPVILEIGVSKGGSIEMWNYYFDNQCQIYGLDIDPKCKELESHFNNVKIFIGDQSDSGVLQMIRENMPKIDVLIDDGSHVNEHLVKTFNALYDHLQPGGVYLIEDLHTCYWSAYGGGLRHPSSFIEFSKPLIDELNFTHIPNGQASKYSQTMQSLHYYDSVLVVEKFEKYVPVQATIRGPGV